MEQQNWDNVEKIKQQLRKGNCSYINRHPELRAIIRVFLHELIDKQPENIYEFSSALFNCNNTPLLVTKINQQLKRVNEHLRKSHWSLYDGDMAFSEKASTLSLLSRDSMAEDIDDMLRFALILRERK